MQNLASDVDTKVFGLPSGGSSAQWLKGPQGSAVWAGITTGDVSGLGPQLPAVVNGSWVYGSGGAATWKTIAQGDLPANVGTSTALVSDCNAITQSGWYNGSSVSNAPRSDWIFVLHVCHIYNPTMWITQTCWSMQANPPVMYMRSCLNGSWTAWTQISNTGQSYRGGIGSGVNSGGADISVSFSPGFSVACDGLAVCPNNPSTQNWIPRVTGISASGFSFRAEASNNDQGINYSYVAIGRG